MLANHDLEIRGAGDLLGENQSGKISEIGFNLYHDLLKRTVDAIKNNSKFDLDDSLVKEIEINTGIPCVIPQTYLDDVHERLVFYKRISSSKNDDDLKELKIEMIDRFGLLPDSINNLFASTSLRIFAEKIGITKINIFDDMAEITLSKNNYIEPTKIINLIQKSPQTYKLKNQNTLIFNAEMKENYTRIEKVRTLAESLN